MDNNQKIIKLLKSEYPNPKCELNYGSPFELLVAVVLSAQCTDKRVNAVTAELFKTHNTAELISKMDIEVLEEKIKSCGFYHNKAKAIKSLSQDIVTRFNGEFPKTKAELKTLAGVGEKTANVVVSLIYNEPAIAVDTHVFRVSNRLGLAKATTPEKTQKQLEKVLEKDFWSKAHYAMVLHGRYVCKAIKPRCNECAFCEVCKFFNSK
ncbi:MAG: endonuclease III [Clostridia bacterium]|nr:endonuclease III [Clostridia bacterium]